MSSELDLVPQEIESEAVAFNFAGENIYVRKCYPEYYLLLLEKLGKKHIKMLSITGTPGIGKSTFYLYFQMRYHHDYIQRRRLRSCPSQKTDSRYCRAKLRKATEN